MISGDPGIGKTTLLGAGTASGFAHLLRVDGYEAESTMPFAALQRLTIPLAGGLHHLPDRQRQALQVAVGVAEGPAPDRYLVGLGVLGLLAASAGEGRPLACAVDDAHLLDAESLDVLAFVARRLEAEAVVLVFATRPGEHIEARMAGIERLHLEGLARQPALALLMSSVGEPLDPAVAAQVVTATGGNPLALVDLADELSAREMTESSLADEPFPVGRHLEAFYVRQVRRLPEDLQQWLLVAAADSTGNTDLIRNAVDGLGLDRALADRAEKAGLMDVGDFVAFRHPLVASAAYNAAHGHQRRAVHRALAAAAEALGAVELEAWHSAKATVGTDAAVAGRLERVADLAGQRGGFSSRARVLVQASALTPEGAEKYARLVAAAEAALNSGAAHLAKALLDRVDEHTLDAVSLGRMTSVLAQFAIFTADPALTHAAADSLVAAAHFRGRDPAREQAALIQAFSYTLPAERLAEGTLTDLGHRLGEGAGRKSGIGAVVLEGLSAHILLPYAKAVPIMRRAVDAIAELHPPELLQFGLTSVALTTALWDRPRCKDILERTAAAARDAGSMHVLDSVLWTMSIAELRGGSTRQASQYMDQVRELRRAIGYDAEHVVNVALLALTDAPRTQVERIAEEAGAVGFGGVASSGQAALALRDLAEGLYPEAFSRLQPLIAKPFLQVTPLEWADFVEAGVRCHRIGEVAQFVEALEEMARANGSPWNRGVAARARALISGRDAEPHFRAAIVDLEQVAVEVELGRTHLLFGEWLRRARRRGEARGHLRTAVALFDRAGGTAFARRARTELEATGGSAGPDDPPAGIGLTPQELTIARLAASGHTNGEIGSTMFLSPNTVDYHLRKVFQKLGVSSRRQLADHLPRQA